MKYATMIHDIPTAIISSVSCPQARTVTQSIYTRLLEGHVSSFLYASSPAYLATLISSEIRREAEWVSDLDEDGVPKAMVGVATPDDLDVFIDEAERKNGGTFKMPFADGDEELVKEFSDGYTIVRLVTHEARNREYNRFGSRPAILGRFESEDYDNGNIGTLVLRDSEDVSLAIIGLNRIAITDVSGWNGNTVDQDLVRDYIMPLKEELDLFVWEPCSIPYYVEAEDGTMHDIYSLPDGIVVRGDMRLHDKYPDIVKLPNNMTVYGDLTLYALHMMKSSPDNLVVHGGLGIIKCKSLRHLGEGTAVREWVSLEGCDNLVSIGEGCYFAGGILFPDKPELLKFPFKYEGKVSIGSAGKSVPDIMFAGIGDMKPLAGLAGKVADYKHVAKKIFGSNSIVKRTKGKGGIRSMTPYEETDRFKSIAYRQDFMDNVIAERRAVMEDSQAMRM